MKVMKRILDVLLFVYMTYFKHLKKGTTLKKIRSLRLNIDKLKDIVIDCETNADYYSFFKYSAIKWFLMSVYMKLPDSRSKEFKNKEL